jgi:hemerythrin
MGLFLWKPEYSVSVSIFDAQHKKLFALAETLQDAMRAGKGRDVLARCLDELVAYTKSHFAEEESLMSRCGYNGLAAHKRQHTQLIEKISEFRTQFASGNSMISIEVMDLIRDWIATHILQVDHEYADFFNQQGVY